jgi:hypothetical protein
MWKKISFAAVLGLCLSPPAAMAGTLFDPFEGIVEGIAQELATTQDLSISSTYDNGSDQGGNVVVGNGLPGSKQSASLAGDLAIDAVGGEGRTAQAVNLHRGEVQVMAMQATDVAGIATVSSSNSVNAIQGINLVTTCGAAGCE